MTSNKFSIILPTYKRPDAVTKAIDSVINQTYGDWQLYIIIDDVISDYTETKKKYANDLRIIFSQNPENVGKNQSLNRTLNKLKRANFNGFIIYLDDDDWLNPQCLTDFNKSIERHPNQNWFVSERVNANTKQSFTVNKTKKEIINYQYDMLFRRTFFGDATHCIKFSITKNVRFPTLIKNAEEWLYFSELSFIQKNFRYLPVVGTYSEGYAPEGLTNVYHTQNESWINNKLIVTEIWQRRLLSLYVILYLLGRLSKAILRK